MPAISPLEKLNTHYGFSRAPFTAAVPIQALCGHAAHNQAVARIGYLLATGGLGVVTGAVGSGKTTAARHAVDGLDTSRNTILYLPNPQIGTRGIHGAIAQALGEHPRFHHATLIPQVQAALHTEATDKNRRLLLILDEAHLLQRDQLEALRMLTNGSMDSASPITILMIGQPTLRTRLRHGDMTALDQRVAIRYHLPTPTMTLEETDTYLRAHLAHAGRTDTLFNTDAVAALHTAGRGTPRALNQLATSALLAAYLGGKTIVDDTCAHLAITETSHTPDPAGTIT